MTSLDLAFNSIPYFDKDIDNQMEQVNLNAKKFNDLCGQKVILKNTKVGYIIGKNLENSYYKFLTGSRTNLDDFEWIKIEDIDIFLNSGSGRGHSKINDEKNIIPKKLNNNFEYIQSRFIVIQSNLANVMINGKFEIYEIKNSKDTFFVHPELFKKLFFSIPNFYP